MNAAHAYSYYGMKEAAVRTLEELSAMQQDDDYGKAISEKCTRLVRDIQLGTVSYD